MKTTLSEVEIRYYKMATESQVEAVLIEIRNQKAVQGPGHEDTLEILERLRDKLADSHDAWNKIEDIFYPKKDQGKSDG